MTRVLDRLAEVAADYDAVVLDQWGVLHDGSAPYPGAVATLDALRADGLRLAVLSNSGKRAAPNATRIAAMGFDPGLFETVMTSGEALWRDMAEGHVSARRLFPIERAAGDATAWAEGLPVMLCPEVAEADAVLLMGLPDGTAGADWQPILDHALARGLPVYCSNPDKASPRAGGETVVSPGALAHAHKARGGTVAFYGKPHAPVFRALETALGSARLLMVGDSLEHDIAGAASAGWDSLLIEGGLYAARFAHTPGATALAALRAETGTPAPTYRLETLR